MENQNKKIFQYFNGIEDVFADPAEIDYRWMKASETEDMDTIYKWFDFSEDEIGSNVPTDDPQVMKHRKMRENLFIESCHRLDPIIRKSFGIKPFDTKTGLGMLHEDVMYVYLSYMEWKYNLKKNID